MPQCIYRTILICSSSRSYILTLAIFIFVLIRSCVDFQPQSNAFAPPSWRILPAETKAVVRCHCDTPPLLRVFHGAIAPSLKYANGYEYEYQYRALIARNGAFHCHCNARLVAMNLMNLHRRNNKSGAIAPQAYFTLTHDHPTAILQVRVRPPLRRSIVSLLYLVAALLALLFVLIFISISVSISGLRININSNRNSNTKEKKKKMVKMRMFRVVKGELRSTGQTCEVTLRYGARISSNM